MALGVATASTAAATSAFTGRVDEAPGTGGRASCLGQGQKKKKSENRGPAAGMTKFIFVFAP